VQHVHCGIWPHVMRSVGLEKVWPQGVGKEGHNDEGETLADLVSWFWLCTVEQSAAPVALPVTADVIAVCLQPTWLHLQGAAFLVLLHTARHACKPRVDTDTHMVPCCAVSYLALPPPFLPSLQTVVPWRLRRMVNALTTSR